jgi:hypothetical protein
MHVNCLSQITWACVAEIFFREFFHTQGYAVTPIITNEIFITHMRSARIIPFYLRVETTIIGYCFVLSGIRNICT